MKHVGHFIAGARQGGARDAIELLNPSTGDKIGDVIAGTEEDVDRAVTAAKSAFATWAAAGMLRHAETMLDLRDALKAVRGELISIVVEELGKTNADASAELDRAIEVLAQASAVGSWLGAKTSRDVSRGVDVQEVRFPIGVVAGISPFNFPVLIPVVQSAMAIACGNTVVLKPSERAPSACLRIAESFRAAGLPDGVLNVVMGDRAVVDRLLSHPDVAGISFVGSTDVARRVRAAGVLNGKRVQAFGGGKNHMVVLPDADLDLAADAAVSAAFGAAGQRCMAISVLLAVGDVADPLVEKIAHRMDAIEVGLAGDASTQLGPVVGAASRARIAAYLAGAEGEGAKLVVDGRGVRAPAGGWFIGPSLVDHVRPGALLHRDEIFGPVLAVVRVASQDEAAKVIADHPLGNGAAIFTRSGAAARRFVEQTEAGQVGVNVPIPFPVFFHSFGGWKDSAFTETKLFGPGAVDFLTRTKTVSTRWPAPASSRVDLGFPSHD